MLVPWTAVLFGVLSVKCDYEATTSAPDATKFPPNLDNMVIEDSREDHDNTTSAKSENVTSALSSEARDTYRRFDSYSDLEPPSRAEPEPGRHPSTALQPTTRAADSTPPPRPAEADPEYAAKRGARADADRDKADRLRSIIDRYKMVVNKELGMNRSTAASDATTARAATTPTTTAAPAASPARAAAPQLPPETSASDEAAAGAAAQAEVAAAIAAADAAAAAGAVLRSHGAPPSAAELDMAPARGGVVHTLRTKNRLCHRHVMIPEGPKYNSKGKQYLAEYQRERARGREFPNTAPPRLLLPKCCNCCRKSVLGCE